MARGRSREVLRDDRGSSVSWVTLQSLGYSRVFSIVIQPTCLLNPSFVLAAIWEVGRIVPGLDYIVPVLSGVV